MQAHCNVNPQDSAKKETKKHLKTARIGIQGEAYFEYIMSDNAIVHKIATNKDTGVDFLCHWLYEDMPTNKMFAVQVKTRTSVKPKDLATVSKYNGLSEYSINVVDNSLDKADISFWKLFNIPVYLFVLIYGKESISCYYKRLTPSITLPQDTPSDAVIKKIKGEPFYKIDHQRVYDASNTGYGFYRDLFIDSVRCMYSMGAIYTRDLANQAMYLDLLNDYADQIMETEDSIDVIVGFMESDRKKNKRLYPNLYKLCER